MRYKVILVFILLLGQTRTSAQFIFQNIREEDGLSAKEVRCLHRDKDGFLWIGTSNGLNRFDGAVIKKYMGFDSQKNLFITAIMPMANEKFLLLATGKGLVVFNKQTGKFYKDARFSKLDNQIIMAVKTDHRKRIWIVTSKDVYLYDNHTLQKARDIIASAKAISNTDFSSLAFIWDRYRKGFWLGGNHVYFIDCDKDIVLSKSNNPERIPILDTPQVYVIAVDRKANLWYGSDQYSTLSYWDRHTRKITTYSELDGIKLNGFNNIFIDNRERIWLSTYLFAGFLKEPGHSFRKIPFDQNQKYSISYGFFNEAIQDKDGNVWLATINGVSKSPAVAALDAIYQLPSFESFLETGFSHANSITVDGKYIMAAKADGIVQYNMLTRFYKRYAVEFGKDLGRNEFYNAVKAGQTWWFAGYAGIFYLHQQKLYPFEKAKKGHAPFIFTDHQKNIWFQVWDDALYRYNPLSGQCTRFDGKDPKYGLFDLKNAISYLVTRSGNILFAEKGTGFLKFDPKQEKFSVVPVKNSEDFDQSSFAMLEDAQANIWVGIRGKGLIKLNDQGKYLDSLDTSNGLILDKVNSIAMDTRGYIWVATREGLTLFDPATKAVTNVELDFGKTLQNYWNYAVIDQGKVYLVMLDQVVVINPLLFSKIQVKKPPHITAFRVFEKEYSLENGKLPGLEFDENYIRLQFASLYHKDIPSLQYRYQLQGWDKSWINAGRTLTASYNKLPAGTYTFKVCSTDSNGRWMSSATSLTFTIYPAWWQTWWFICIMAILTGLAAGTLYNAYRRNQSQTAMQKTIAYFANSSYGENIVHDICWDITRNCISQLQFESCTVYLVDKSNHTLVKKAANNSHTIQEQTISHLLENETEIPLTGQLAALKDPLIVSDSTPQTDSILESYPGLSVMLIPVLYESSLIGIIVCGHSQKDYFNQKHAQTLITIASISANRIAEAQAQQQALEKERMLLEISKMLSDSQLVALRAQMNPHFVFNCLNSIQECIVTESYRDASKYLNKFSKLLRMILNNSNRNLVSINEEQQVLGLYLELEQMRFDNSFSYQLSVDPALLQDQVLLPSMLLQPYVENAIWHGLMHKDGSRKLTIAIRKVNDEIFECRIEDNGIGREQSRRIKESNSPAKDHSSKGMQISQDRLDLLRRQGQFTQLEIIDKYDQQGLAQGTVVVIQLSALMEEI